MARLDVLDEIFDYLDNPDCLEYEEYADKLNALVRAEEFGAEAYRYALEVGNDDYTEEHADEFDEECNYKCSRDCFTNPYDEDEEDFDEEDEEICNKTDWLTEEYRKMSMKAFEYDEISNTVTFFSNRFAKEVFKRYLENAGLSEDTIQEILECSFDAMAPYVTNRMLKDMRLLGIKFDDGPLQYGYYNSFKGKEIAQLLKKLGYALGYHYCRNNPKNIKLYYVSRACPMKEDNLYEYD